MIGRLGRWAAVVAAGLLAAACAGDGAAGLAEQRRPANIIVILADDLGYGDMSAYGGWVPTPNAETMAREGVRFTNGYVTAAVCAPSRAALLAGRSQTRFGWEFNPVGRDAATGLPASETTIAAHLKAAGYATGMVGKWHIGQGPGFHPLDRGFDSFFGVLGGASDFITVPAPGDSIAKVQGDQLTARARFPVTRGREVVEEPRYLTEAFTAEARGFIRANRDRPFFLYLSYTAPHTPLQATARYADRFKDIEDPYRRTYGAMVSSLDDGLGEIMAEVRAQGLEKDTIIVFLSDNGCASYVKGACTNAPLAGYKGMYWEGGIRVPYILWAPGRTPAGVVSALPVTSLDIMATASAAAARPAPATAEGLDLVALLAGPKEKAAGRGLYWRTGPNYAVRQGRWKLIVVNRSDTVDDPDNVYGSPTPDGVGAVVSPLGQWTLLYDLELDPGETTDLSDRHPEVVRRLMADWQSWDRANVATLFTSRRQFRGEVNGRKVQLYN